MKGKPKKLISTLLTLAMVFSLITIMPITASAASGANLIDLDDFDSSGMWQGGASGTGWEYTDDELSTEDMHKFTITGAVSVTGSATMPTETGIWLDFAGGTVTWSADLYGNTDIICLLYIDNPNGNFLMTGGNINNIGGNAGITIGGTYRNITLSGGMVAATSGFGIEYAGALTLSGGTVTAETGTAIEANEIKVTGTATVSSNPGATAIKLNNGGKLAVDGATASITVNGNIEAEGDEATGVYCLNGATANINGNISVTGTNIVGIWNGDWEIPAPGGTVNMTGHITAIGTNDCDFVEGVFCDTDGTVNMTGNISVSVPATYEVYGLNAVDCFEGGNVAIDGDITVTGNYGGIIASSSSTITKIVIDGDVEIAGASSHVWALGNSEITINSNVKIAGDSSQITISGASVLTIEGDVSLGGKYNVIQATESSVLTVDGDVAFTNADTGGCFIAVANGGTIYFLGSVTDDITLMIWNDGHSILDKTVGDPTYTDVLLPAPHDGYYWDEYTDDGGGFLVNPQSYLYIRQDEITTPVVKTVSIGAQTGALTAGTAGSTEYTVTTVNIADGSYTASAANLPAGVTVSGRVTIAANTGTLTLTYDGTGAAGTASNLTLTIDSTPSGNFSIVIAPTGAVIPGDVSGDKLINMQDVLLIYQHFRGKTTLTGSALAAADVSGDDAVNMTDVLLVYQYFRGKIAEFPVSS